MVRREVYSKMGGAVNLKIHALNKRAMRAESWRQEENERKIR